MASGRAAALAVLRGALRAHREKLPPPMRALGDQYITSEFRAMAARQRAGTATEAQWREFLLQWREYTGTLSGGGGGSPAQGGPAVSGELGLEELEAMTDEQRQQLFRLREEARKAGKKMT
mmetsp:Transcript_17459/g.59696  ORF Transcript_17459/g.59696 Transcript_17459/m.59696 type:complete len:121 (-) Transcript_17459:355-717(-)